MAKPNRGISGAVEGALLQRSINIIEVFDIYDIIVYLQTQYYIVLYPG